MEKEEILENLNQLNNEDFVKKLIPILDADNILSISITKQKDDNYVDIHRIVTNEEGKEKKVRNKIKIPEEEDLEIVKGIVKDIRKFKGIVEPIKKEKERIEEDRQEEEKEKEDRKYIMNILTAIQDNKKPIIAKEIDIHSRIHELILELGTQTFLTLLPSMKEVNHLVLENPKEFVAYVIKHISPIEETMKLKKEYGELLAKYHIFRDAAIKYREERKDLQVYMQKAQQYDAIMDYLNLLEMRLCNRCKQEKRMFDAFAVITNPNIMNSPMDMLKFFLFSNQNNQNEDVDKL
ncbi:MAG: hypothetical protein KatS3mg003_2020 [Candidatus Nitrosocaldaceae archaeon]|nr:MAG: hypothetical protein KatS3mg003_2020 [Candidatus Nitrosocaldaceae archaeon]